MSLCKHGVHEDACAKCAVQAMKDWAPMTPRVPETSDLVEACNKYLKAAFPLPSPYTPGSGDAEALAAFVSARIRDRDAEWCAALLDLDPRQIQVVTEHVNDPVLKASVAAIRARAKEGS